MSTVSALNASRRVRKPATVTKLVPSKILTSRSLPFWAAMMVLRKQRTEDGRPRTDENRADAEGQMTSETNPSVLRPPSPVLRLRDRAEADESVIGAPIGRAPHV